jgi:ribose transport system substrate-binding protein
MTSHRSHRRQALRCSIVALAVAAHAGAFAQVANVDVDKEMQEQARLMTATPEGPAGQPWLQRIGGKTVDTAKYKKKGPYTLCFSNASVGNPWRVVGWNTMQAEVELNKADIKGFE